MINMNTNRKNNNGWILCPSKRFPGKFYYFNVNNGEAAWSLNEWDKKILKKHGIVPKVLDKLNCYPEPNSPPVIDDDTLNSSNMDGFCKHPSNCNKTIDQCIPQSHIFSQATFPKYMSNTNPYMPNVMWTPVQLPPQMFVPNLPEEKKQMTDQITQTPDVKEQMLVQTSGLSLSDRFFCYNNTNTHDTTKSYFSYFNNVVETHSDHNLKKNEDILKLCNNYDKLLISSNKETRLKMKGSLLREPMLKKTFKKRGESDSSLMFFNEDNKKSTLKPASPEKGKVIKKAKLDLTKNTLTKVLDKSDLRLLLVAKKNMKLNTPDSYNRKSLKGEDTVTSFIKTRSQSCPKKQVTFDLIPQTDEESVISGHKNIDSGMKMRSLPEVINIHTLRNLGKVVTAVITNIWFIVVDLNVMLNDFEYIDMFVRGDENCRLLIPNAVMSKIKDLSTFKYNGCRPVLAARTLIRRLLDPPQHIILQEPVQDINISISKEILNCCFNLIGQGYHVVLITTDTELYAKGVTLDLHCYMMQQIKDGIANIQSQSSFDSIKNHDENKDEQKINLFLQKPNKLQSFMFENKDEVYNKKIETKLNDINNNVDMNTQRLKIKMLNFKMKVKNDVNNGINNQENQTDSPGVVRTFDFKNRLHLNSAKSNQNSEFQYCASNMFENRYPNILSMDCPFSLKESRIQSLSVQEKPHSNSNYNICRIFNIKKTIPNTDVSVQSNVTGSSKRLPNEGTLNKEFFFISVDNSPTHIISSNIEKTTVDNSISDYENPRELLEECLYKKLKRFYLKNKVMADRIVLRADEWMCTFTQIMENFMIDIIRTESTSTSAYPCSILDAADDVAKLFDKQAPVKIAAYGLSALCNLISPNGKLSNINPNDVIKAIGCGKLLVESLKNVIPHSEYLMETEKLLVYLLYRIEDPKSDPKQIELINTATVSRFDSDEDICTPKRIFIKKPSAVLMYLKKHFPELREIGEESCNENTDNAQQNNGQNHTSNVVRTIGRHLNLLKINSSNEMTLDVTDNGKENQTTDTKLKITKFSCKSSKENERWTNCDSLNDFPMTLENTFNDNFQMTSGSRVVREVGIIKSFEDKLKNKSVKSDLNGLSSDSIFAISEDIGYTHVNGKANGLFKYEDVLDGLSETFTEIAYQTEVDNSDIVNDKSAMAILPLTPDGSNNDSGLGNEYCHAYSLIKGFFVELSTSLKIVHKFINDSALEIRGKDVKEEDKRVIYDRTNKTYKYISIIIDKLKRIIEREPDDSTTIKSLLIKAGVDVASDKRVSRYNQVVTKCLEQASLLQQGLKVLLSITNENCDPLIMTSEIDSIICYFNIFE